MSTRSLSIFDLDHTLIGVNSSLEFTKYLVKKRCLSKRALFLIFVLYCTFKVFPLALPLLHKIAFRVVFKGANIEMLTKKAEKFWDEKLSLWLHKEVLDQLKHAQEQGHYTALLSNSPDFFIQFVAKKLQFDFCKGSIYQNVNGKLDKVEALMTGVEKAQMLNTLCEKEGIDVANTYAYTDCLSDLPLLAAVGTPCAVNPAEKLKKHCKQNDWRIILAR